MIKNILIVALVLLLVLLTHLFVRRPEPPPPPPGGPRPPSGAPDRLRTIQGIVLGYHNNAHLDVNSIQFKTSGEGTINVDFRPHTAQAVMNCAKAGDSVRLAIGSAPNDESVVYQLHRIENLRTHREADLDALPPPPDVPPQFAAENFTVKQPQLLTDSYGGIDAIRDGQLLFHFKPGLVDDISALIKSANTVTLSAVRRSDEFGFVNINHDKVYIVVSITIDNKTFLVR